MTLKELETLQIIPLQFAISSCLFTKKTYKVMDETRGGRTISRVSNRVGSLKLSSFFTYYVIF